ncbi:histone H1 [bacterium]|nr:histone H1 [bacterium]
METFQEIKNLIDRIEPEFHKFAEKGNKAAGTRVRVAMQELKRLAQQIRLEVQEQKANAA